MVSSSTTTQLDSQSSQQTTIIAEQQNSQADTIQCTSCRRPIVSCFDACLHPMLSTIVCKSCHDAYGDGDFSVYQDHVDEFGDENYCRWCMDGGELLVCANVDHYAGKKCHYAFCQDCIKRNLPNYELKHSIAFPFICFACDPSPLELLRKESLIMVKKLSREQPSQIEDDSTDTENIADEQEEQNKVSKMQLESATVNNSTNSNTVSVPQIEPLTEKSTNSIADDNTISDQSEMALEVQDANLSDDIATNGDCSNLTQMERMQDRLDADAYFKHLKKDDLAYLSYNPRVYDAGELTTLLNNIKEDKRLILDHHSNFFDRLMEECQACIDGQMDPCSGRKLLNLMREQSFIEVKNLLIMYRKIDSLIESLPID